MKAEYSYNVLYLCTSTLYSVFILPLNSVCIACAAARFSRSKCTSGLRISEDGRKVEHSKDNRREERAFCELPTHVFKVKIVSNPRRANLYIGFVLATDELLEFWKNSWLIETGAHCLLVGDEWRGGRGLRIAEGSSVSVEKLFEERALVFRVNGEVIHDKVLTGLNAEDFTQLIGSVLLYGKGDVVKIIRD